MCRWFAYISPKEPCLLSDALITPPHGITKQVSSHYLPYLTEHHLAQDLRALDLKLRNLALNADGGGIAVYTPSSSAFTSPSASTPILYPAVYKSVQPLNNDLNFRSLAENTETTCLLAHVRAGSGAPVSTLNCHPFVFGRWSIMHNGAVGHVDGIRRELLHGLGGDVYAAVKGGTDSEVISALVIEDLTGGNGRGKEEWHSPRSVKEVLEAIQGAFKTIITAQRKFVVDGEQVQPSSLNVCVTDGTVLVATRFRNSDEEQPPSLYWSTKAGVTLNRKYPGHPDQEEHERFKGVQRDVKGEDEHGRHVIVASEPSTFIEEDWKLLSKNSALLVGTKGELNFQELGPY
ncbi:N-terminal nucleophile aminohydrolase [Myriangium duriaei CBS 260.36]|uniref:N-terminal nucleophile aminohydrolase n=1 Tax=Myriangium duriaei CBS 260.36 TaxID=1168546 RepID=A0A9P4MKU7_9PEZI|nr:N-terminal nucleophile aminohydrolase [Myriangium duriaei CBS 260.36]